MNQNTDKSDKKDLYKNYKRKRDSILFLLVFPTSVLIVSFIVFYTTKIVNFTDIVTIYIVLMLLDIGLLFIFVPKFYLYKMYFDYSKMIINEPKMIDLPQKIYTSSWIDKIKEEGYELVQEDLKHLLLCKYYKKLPQIPNSDATMVFVCIAKNAEFDFYSDTLDSGMQLAYMKDKKFGKVNKQITLQFKKFEKLNDDAVSEVETAILYQAGKHIMTNITFAYIKDKCGIYCIDSKGWYPNKYVYFAFSESMRLCKTDEKKVLK